MSPARWSSCCGAVVRVAKAIFGQQAGAVAVVMINNASTLPPFEGPITANPDTGEAIHGHHSVLRRQGQASSADDKLSRVDRMASAIGEGAPIQTGTSGFSSAGPRTGDSFLKPDISAPGEAIISAGVGTGNGPATISGTSMASPHVAGVAALVRQAHPSWSPGAVKAAIINSGEPGAIAGYVSGATAAAWSTPPRPQATLAYAFSGPSAPALSFGLAEFTTSAAAHEKRSR